MKTSLWVQLHTERERERDREMYTPIQLYYFDSQKIHRCIYLSWLQASLYPNSETFVEKNATGGEMTICRVTSYGVINQQAAFSQQASRFSWQTVSKSFPKFLLIIFWWARLICLMAVVVLVYRESVRVLTLHCSFVAAAIRRTANLRQTSPRGGGYKVGSIALYTI